MASFEQSMSVLSQAMTLRTQRQQVLASNIANADTPGYKARDFDFAAAMRNAVAGREGMGGMALAETAAGHMGGSGAAGPADLQYRTETQSAVDGNTVDMDVERTQITDNALQYQILAQIITAKFHDMRTALTPVSG